MSGWDVVVLGEMLVEVASDGPWHDGAPVRMGFSGDALNAAAAAAAAGARTALLARVPDDEVTDAALERVRGLGISTDLLRRAPGQHGVYWVRADPRGARGFTYARGGSAGSRLDPGDVAAAGLEEAGWVVASGITAALSAPARAAVLEAARRAPRFAYDPNHRPALSGAAASAAVLREVAPRADLVVPSWPGETCELLGTDDPAAAAAALLRWGAGAVAVTCGAEGVLVDDGAGPERVPAAPAPSLRDATGAGDSFLGTTVARLGQGAVLRDAVADGCLAAAACLGGRGGLGHLDPGTAPVGRAAASGRSSAAVGGGGA